MKELILVRHAKSDWGTEQLKDVDRPLNERGYSDAYFMSKWYLKEKALPQLIISSYATRAMSTAFIFARTFNTPLNSISITDKLYESKVDNFISLIAKQNDKINSVMIFFHNPCITDVSNLLNEAFFIDNVPTCGIISLKLNIDSWKDVNEKKGSLNYLQFPKDFRNKD
jgi:phosphohistidine phosphatase